MSTSNANTSRPTKYESAVDGWIVFMVLLTPLVSAVIAGYLIMTDRPGDATWLLIVGVAALAVTAAFAVPCRYTILDDALSIRCGILFYQIPLAEINDVDKSSSWMSGPALSLKRVAVITDRKRYLISPKDRDDFIRDLRKAVKQAKT